ncbi:TatD family hydrolase [Keratinibaculum paraultunense]|nr:TatD family hydrolase [Keratinibaculum paraultunense]QQY79053.1 TatD family hydrolase [Keratinibaculum paraultunense]
MKIIKYDTHTHLDLYDDIKEKLQFIEENKIYSIIMTNIPKLYLRYKAKYHNLKYSRFALGLHPELAVQFKSQLKLFLDYVAESRYIGEIGLDFSNGVNKEQILIFEKIIDSCSFFNDKIISIHSRNAVDSVIDIVGESKNRIILHWFTGTDKELERAIAKGYYFSLNIDMLNTKKGKNLLLTVPSSKLLIESDSPFTKYTKNDFTIDYFDKFYMLSSKILGKSEEEVKLLFSSNFIDLLSNI